MADITGPCKTLPGHRHKVPEGTMCDYHPDKPAIARIQGETDSFGSELHDMCQECVSEYENQIKEHDTGVGVCDWCKSTVSNEYLHPHRDFEEGSSGRVYTVCVACINKQHDELEGELYRDRDNFVEY